MRYTKCVEKTPHIYTGLVMGTFLTITSIFSGLKIYTLNRITNLPFMYYSFIITDLIILARYLFLRNKIKNENVDECDEIVVGVFNYVIIGLSLSIGLSNRISKLYFRYRKKNFFWITVTISSIFSLGAAAIGGSNPHPHPHSLDGLGDVISLIILGGILFFTPLVGDLIQSLYNNSINY